MIRLIKFFVLFCLIITPLSAQNLFDETNTSKFAGYLYQTQQYSLAAQEYERLVFLAPSDLNYKLSLVKSYRLTGDYTLARKRFNGLFGDSIYSVNNTLSAEYLKSILLQEDLSSAQDFINRSKGLDLVSKTNYQSYIYLLGRKWKKADSVLSSQPSSDQKLVLLCQSGLRIHHKSPFLAGTFSAILPGTGKVYTGFWKDGIVSFLFVAANAWQTYRGFSKDGVRSTQGWIFGGLTAGFYLGNIYGSVKSAVKHNKRANDAIYNESKSIIFSGF